MNRRRITWLVCISACVLFAFQNCGRTGFLTATEEELLNSSLIGVGVGGKASAPMAYDTGLDIISYNSCVPNVKGAAGYYTLKATAGNGRGGFRLTPEFLTAATSSLKPILNNAQVLDVQYKELLEQTHPTAEAQLALRSVTDLRAVFIGTTSGGIWNGMDMLSDDAWLTPLVESGRYYNNAWVGYSNRAPYSKSKFGGTFSQEFSASDYWSSLLSAKNFRDCTAQGCQGYGQFHIAAGFSDESNRSVLRGPSSTSTNQARAYGRGYQLQFGYPGNQPAAGMRVVKGVNEYSLQTGNGIVENGVATRWSCTEIPIMSPNQRGKSDQIQTSAYDSRYQTPLCNPMSGSFATTYFSQLDLDRIRQILPSSQWQIGYQNANGATRLCAIPVGFDCYPNETFQNYQLDGTTKPYPYYVEYTPGNRCLNEDNMGTELSRTDAAALNSVCGHYITICTKQ